ncbi:MAG: hypothetical protein V4638_05645 [Bacteroidota bacterium]
MACILHVYLLNDLYSQKEADLNHGGKETEDNRKYLWEDEMRISGTVTSVVEIESATYPLRGIAPDGTEFSHDVAMMQLVEIKTDESPVVYIGASASMVEKCYIDNVDNEYSIRLYLKDDEPHANPIPGIYIASKEFPKELAN